MRGEFLDLEPLAPEHVEPLFAVSPRETFHWFTSVPADDSLDAFRAFLDERPLPDFVTMVGIVRATGQPVACSTFFDALPAHRSLEIGYTWIAPAARGTFVNPDMKRTMMAHAFDDLGAVRVQLKTDARNLQSQAAMRKLGLVEEGTLRHHRVMPDGHLRHTVFFSAIPDEWPAIRARLDDRLAAFRTDSE